MITSADSVRLSDISTRTCSKPILGTTAMYGPWTPDGSFDHPSYERLLREVYQAGIVPATNVDTTWAQYNTWKQTEAIVEHTARVAAEFADRMPADRPLLVVGLNTNRETLAASDIAPAIRTRVEALQPGLARAGLHRVRYMPVPDRRLLAADRRTKVAVYRDIGAVIGDATEEGMVFFELDIGIPDFGSDFELGDITEILAATPQIREYKSAVIAAKPGRWAYPYDMRDDVARIMVVEQVAPARVQFSTGNDWCIRLATLGANLPRFGYLLGASQISPPLFRLWTDLVEADDPAAVLLEQDLQQAARDFWTPGNVGIYRHYIAILLALTGRIDHPLPHPDVDARFRVRPDDCWLPLKHALRLGLLDRTEAAARARTIIPEAAAMTAAALDERIRLMG